MDYEKKYKEALERAKNYHDNNFSFGTTKLTEAIFPELRESEDERIRKAVVSLVYEMKGTYQSFAKVELDKMVTWLEKQKEPHIPWYDYQKSKEAGYTIVPNEEYEQLVKQKEQKPAVSREEILHQLLQNGSITLSDYLYLTEKQKPAEWSEEDESELTAVIYCVSRAIKASKDENERNSLLSAKKWLQDKLSFRVKFLRPSWKPSKEQIEALEKAVVRSCSHDYGVFLSELYEQLKKL